SAVRGSRGRRSELFGGKRTPFYDVLSLFTNHRSLSPHTGKTSGGDPELSIHNQRGSVRIEGSPIDPQHRAYARAADVVVGTSRSVCAGDVRVGAQSQRSRRDVDELVAIVKIKVGRIGRGNR